MKYLFIIVIFLSFHAGAQLKSFQLTSKGDTMNRIDSKGLKQGPWVIHVDDLRGERGFEDEGYYWNNNKEGVWKRFSLEGDLIALENYEFGMKSGKCMYFTNAGMPLRQESWRAIDPKSPYDTIDILDVNDPSKVLRKQIIKIEPNSYKHGTWTYYNTMTGGVESTEQWVMNKPKEEIPEGDDMAPIDITDGETTTVKKKDKPAEKPKPQAILDYEKKNAKKKIKVRDGRTGG